MATLVDLVKLGAIGASAAFLFLSFSLLRAEQALSEPRTRVLREIRLFQFAALLFLIAGVVSEFILRHGEDIVAAFNKSMFANDLVRVRLSNWEYLPEKRLITFGFEEKRSDSDIYLLAAKKRNYDVYIGVRKRDATPAAQGQYDLFFGPYPISTQQPLNHYLSDDELQRLGNNCILFTAFGIKKSDQAINKIVRPFYPGKSGGRLVVFNYAWGC